MKIALRTDRSLAGGMAIAAAVEARLLGFRLLSLDAIVDVVPAEAEREETEALDRNRLRPSPSRSPRSRRRPGTGLAAASRAISDGAEQLRSARAELP